MRLERWCTTTTATSIIINNCPANIGFTWLMGFEQIYGLGRPLNKELVNNTNHLV